jgi:single-stranded-DNA-specific exonuclease
MKARAWAWRREAPAGLAPWLRLGAAWSLEEGAARLAWARGLDEEGLAWRLDPAWSRSTDPHLLPGVDGAVARIRRAIEAGERIVVYGDYDVDGVTASALLLRVLERLGAQASFFIPNRFNDGYGLHLDCIRELKEARNPSLLISVDCGVRSAAEVSASAELGLEWIITDHHALGPGLPPATAVVHPLREGYANPHLSGVGVAFKLAQALLGAVPAPTGADAAFLDGLLKLVAIGTLADMVPLLGENALLVRRGLEALGGANGPGLAALLKAARVEGTPTGQDIAFGVAPRLNAVGRMGGAEDAVRLLLARDAGEAAALMERVETLNQDRRRIQRELAERLSAPGDGAFDLLVEPGAHKGVIGIVAGSRMRDSDKPTAVCTVLDGIAHCSLRAPEGFDLTDLLERARPFLLGGGGHRAAAGMSFESARLPFVRQSLDQGAREQASARKGPSPLRLDGWGLRGVPAAEDLARLEPYGQGFPAPLFGVAGPLEEPVSAFGEGHWKLKVQGQKLSWFFAEQKVAQAPVRGDALVLAVSPQDSARWGRSWIVEAPLEGAP